MKEEGQREKTRKERKWEKEKERRSETMKRSPKTKFQRSMCYGKGRDVTAKGKGGPCLSRHEAK